MKKPIVRLNPERPFLHYLDVYRGVLPDARTRWRTRMLKIKLFEPYIANHPTYLYIAIRADEAHRKGYISTKPNLISTYPFIEDGITEKDVYRILKESGLGLPEFYRWRSRSGCYFCFFQQRIEWVGLLENHPDLFEKAKEFERIDPITGEAFTWNPRESLQDLQAPERIEQIKREAAERARRTPNVKKHSSLLDILAADEEEGACLICHL